MRREEKSRCSISCGRTDSVFAWASGFGILSCCAAQSMGTYTYVHTLQGDAAIRLGWKSCHLLSNLSLTFCALKTLSLSA
ncbi:hypothetical protein BDV12DRAFT_54432 [Aspergillus spectabilis]